jgi:hypothetical protein
MRSHCHRETPVATGRDWTGQHGHPRKEALLAKAHLAKAQLDKAKGRAKRRAEASSKVKAGTKAKLKVKVKPKLNLKLKPPLASSVAETQPSVRSSSADFRWRCSASAGSVSCAGAPAGAAGDA